MLLALLAASIHLSLVDQLTHKIRNRDLALITLCFSGISFHSNGSINLASTIIMLMLGVLGMRFGLGAGDVKLGAVLALFFLPLELSKWIQLASAFTWSVFFLLIIQLIRRRPLSEPIALAPAICAAFIWCAR